MFKSYALAFLTLTTFDSVDYIFFNYSLNFLFIMNVVSEGLRFSFYIYVTYSTSFIVT